jgi:hypothetical protein
MRFSEWRDDLQASLQNGIGGHRIEATGFSVSKWSVQKLGENQKS